MSKEHVEEVVTDELLTELLKKNEFNRFDTKGYYLLGACIQRVAKNMNIALGSVCELRREVARDFEITDDSVSRAIDHLIDSNPSWSSKKQKSVINELASEYVSLKKKEQGDAN